MSVKKSICEGVSGTILGFNFEKGGTAEIVLNISEAAGILYEGLKNTTDDKELIAAVKTLSNRLVNNCDKVIFNAMIARKGVRFEPVVPEIS